MDLDGDNFEIRFDPALFPLPTVPAEMMSIAIPQLQCVPIESGRRHRSGVTVGDMQIIKERRLELL